MVGALKAAEDRGVRFNKVAGTSSGAIIASLIASGYTADEIEKILLQTPFTSFLKKTLWHRVRVVGPMVRLFIKKGLYSGESLEFWIKGLLQQKGVRTFGDLKPNQLRIIASDISDGRILVLPEDIRNYGVDPQKLEVASAVRMSASLPYFFDPVIYRKPLRFKEKPLHFKQQFVYIVDGGILSNFPLWIFDKESALQERTNMMPTVGFQLVGMKEGVARKIYGPFTMFQALLATMMDAHDERYIEDHNRFRTIKIPTLGVQTTQFGISRELSKKLYDSGYSAALRFFDKWSVSAYMSQYKNIVQKQKV